MRLTLIRFSSQKFKDELVKMRGPFYENKSISDYLLWLFKERDFTFGGFKKMMEQRRLENIRQVNCFFDTDYSKLGADLHAATYTVKLGGRFRLQGSSRWIGLDEKTTKMNDILPQERSNDFKIEGLDLSRTVIQTNGISNFENCFNLKSLVLRDCYFVDDWFMQHISQIFSNSLEDLDLTGCLKISDRGLEQLSHLSKLKNLKVKNVTGAKNIDYIAILLEDHIPGLIIEGTDHLSDESFKLNEQRIMDEIK